MNLFKFLSSIVFFTYLSINFSFAQETTYNSQIYRVVEEMPLFPGCENIESEIRQQCAEKKMMDYVFSEMKYFPLEKVSGKGGTVVVKFVIEKDGSVSNAEVTRKVNPTFDEEALRVINSMPKWNPGVHRGEPARVWYRLPIRFKTI